MEERLKIGRKRKNSHIEVALCASCAHAMRILSPCMRL